VRVLQVHAAYRQPGGEDRVVAAEAALLRAAGHEVVAHVVDNPEGAGAAAAALARSTWNAAAARAVRDLARAVRPDVAHVHNTWYALSPSVYGALHDRGVPVVATLHNYRLLCVNGLLFRDGAPCTDCVGRLPWPGVRHRCYRGSAATSAAVAGMLAVHRARGTWSRDVDLWLALTGYARDQLLAGGLPADRTVVKPNTVPDPGPRARPPSASDTVVFAGRLVPEKGVAQLLDAWARAGRSPLRLMVLGDGPLRAELAARRLPGVELAGRRPPEEVRAAMLAARALVFPSRWDEPSSLVVLEALAAGLPVVAADVGAVRELAPGATLVPPDDVAAWSAALDRLGDPAGLDAAGAAGRARWSAAFSPAAGLRDLEGAYARAAARYSAT